MANVVGALPSEVAVMGTLTNNIHNLLASFYKPDKTKNGRYRIIIEGKAFPSDHVCCYLTEVPRMFVLLT